jgi:hypothetical protein
MTRNKIFSSLVCISFVLSCFVLASGQDAPFRLNDKQVRGIIQQLKKDTGKFRKSLDSTLDKSRLNGSNREDNINDFLKDYESATERLYDRFKDNKSVAADVETVLDGAVRIDTFMTRQSVGGRAERDWAKVRQDLRQLAEAYNVTWRWWSVG